MANNYWPRRGGWIPITPSPQSRRPEQDNSERRMDPEIRPQPEIRHDPEIRENPEIRPNSPANPLENRSGDYDAGTRPRLKKTRIDSRWDKIKTTARTAAKVIFGVNFFNAMIANFRKIRSRKAEISEARKVRIPLGIKLSNEAKYLRAMLKLRTKNYCDKVPHLDIGQKMRYNEQKVALVQLINQHGNRQSWSNPEKIAALEHIEALDNIFVPNRMPDVRKFCNRFLGDAILPAQLAEFTEEVENLKLLLTFRESAHERTMRPEDNVENLPEDVARHYYENKYAITAIFDQHTHGEKLSAEERAQILNHLQIMDQIFNAEPEEDLTNFREHFPEELRLPPTYLQVMDTDEAEAGDNAPEDDRGTTPPPRYEDIDQ